MLERQATLWEEIVVIFLSAQITTTTNTTIYPESRQTTAVETWGGSRDFIRKFFFPFQFFFLFIKKDCVLACLHSRRKDDGRGDRSEGETEAESRLFDAVTKREEAHDEFA